ncbi:MAG: SDR family oxidoreductase [Pirellulales bacterium]|nr:SDR family oxidoreductase [Pirellulales bacterium]
MAMLIIGCGYLGQRVAERWRSTGQTVYALTRSQQRAEELAARGWQPVIGDVTEPSSLGSLPAVKTVLHAVGYDRGAGPSMEQVYVGGLRHALDALPPTVERLIYVSSTSVYGQDDGSWVDERSPCEPAGENGRICLAAEQSLAEHPLGQRAVVLRMAGIYGPGRIPRLDAVLRGETIVADADSYLNLVHVDDAAEIVVLAATRSTPPRLYVVGDGQPTTRREFYGELARRLGAEPPKFAHPEPGTSSRGRAATNKRLDNRRLLAELQPAWRFPTFREGLQAIVG